MRDNPAAQTTVGTKTCAVVLEHFNVKLTPGQKNLGRRYPRSIPKVEYAKKNHHNSKEITLGKLGNIF